MFGGIVRNVRLHLVGKVFQTLPLYENLKTVGVYVYATNISVTEKTATVAVESEVRNESGDQQSIELSVAVVDADGKLCAQFKGETADMVGGETVKMSASGALKDVKLWSDATPNLYDVYSVLTVDG